MLRTAQHNNPPVCFTYVYTYEGFIHICSLSLTLRAVRVHWIPRSAARGDTAGSVKGDQFVRMFCVGL